MSQRTRIGILIFVGIALALFFSYMSGWREPVYQGKRVSFWFKKYVASFTPAREHAMEAVAELGPEAIPYLSRMLRKTESPVGRTYRTLWPNLPASVKRWLPQPILPTRLHSDAIACLSEIGQSFKTALPPLLAALNNSEPNTRRAAVLALAEIGPRNEPIVSALIRAAKDKDSEVRSAALSALTQFGERLEFRFLLKPIIPTLIEALHDPNNEVRGRAAQALAGLGRDAATAIPALIELQKLYATARTDPGTTAIPSDFNQSSIMFGDSSLDDQRRWTFFQVTKALIRIDPKLGEALLPILIRTSNTSQKRAQCLEFSPALQALGEKAAPMAKIFSQLLHDLDFSDRIRAADALGQMKTAARGAIPDLTVALQDTNATARLHFADALAKIDSEHLDSAVAALASLLDDELNQVDAARDLGEIGPAARNAVPSLIKALGESDAYLRQIAGESLWKIDRAQAPKIVPVFVQLLSQKNLSHSSRRSLVELLGKIGPEARASVPLLIENLNHRDRRIQLAVAEALWKIAPPQTPRVVTFLTAYLQRKDYWFREVAAELLGKIGPASKAAVPALKRAIEQSDPILRERANEALQKIGSEASESK